MADVQVTSPKYSVNWQDILKGGLLFVLMSVLTPLEEMIRNGGKIDWTVVGGAAITATIAYLVKQFFTDAKVQKTIPNDQVAEVKQASSVDLVVK